jgi:non-lysosomal glucosylceramidase
LHRARVDRAAEEIAMTRSFSAQHDALAFPLGGIGTGNVSLGACGDLRDWEIFNRPGKGTLLPNTFFAIRVQTGNRPAVARVLEGPIQPPHDLSHGYHPSTGAGLPRLAETTFHGEYPFATIEFADPTLPVQVRLEAFTPLIPLNPEDSGLPGAILSYSVTNTESDPVSLSIVGSLINPVGGLARDPFGNLAPGGTGLNRNDFREAEALRGLFLHSEQYGVDSLLHGDMTLATSHADVTVKRCWLRGAWYDFLQEFWDDFTSDGRLDDLGYESSSPMGTTDTCSLGVLDTLAAGETKAYRFLLAWFFPNRTNSWDNNLDAPLIRNRYAARFGSSWDVAQYMAGEMPRLAGDTRRFHGALFGGTLPPVVVDAISANIVPLRSPTCFWLEDGRFLGFEGCFDEAGSCEGNCTHVWSYAQTLAYLFPSLEREMRRIEFEVETDERGYMSFRSHKTFGGRFVWPWADHEPEPAVDGQMGSILRAYREWLLSGDRAWLEAVWPGIKRAIAFAATHWDTDGDSLLDGRQHNTYDIEFHGPNPLCGIYYLAALRAVASLAGVMDEPDLARRTRDAFAAGSRRLDELLWNGEYFVQQLEDVNAHKYQHGLGCLSDQLLGQLYARMLGLGDLLPGEHVRTAIKSVFAHNFKRDFRDHVNCQRTYVLNGESGLVLCSWPHGGRPRFPFVYSDEVWTGIEYQVAAHLIFEGWLQEGIEVVEAVRARHDGVRRNPWNEVECGHHYARSMSSWSLLLALSGFRCDIAAGSVAFAPTLAADDFRCFFSAGTGWGRFEQRRVEDSVSASLALDYGCLGLRTIRLAATQATSAAAAQDGRPVASRLAQLDGVAEVEFHEPLELRAGDQLSIRLALNGRSGNVAVSSEPWGARRSRISR